MSFCNVFLWRLHVSICRSLAFGNSIKLVSRDFEREKIVDRQGERALFEMFVQSVQTALVNRAIVVKLDLVRRA